MSRFSSMVLLGLVACTGVVDELPVSDDDDSAVSTSSASTGGAGGDGASAGEGGDGAGGAGAGGDAAGGAGAGGDAVGGAAMGGQQPTDPACEQLLDTEIVGVSLDDGPDGIWTPGEIATVIVTLESRSGNNIYPGVRVSHASSNATPADGANWLFALLPGMPGDLGVPFEATQTGTFTFDIALEHVNGSCPGTDTATLTVTVP